MDIIFHNCKDLFANRIVFFLQITLSIPKFSFNHLHFSNSFKYSETLTFIIQNFSRNNSLSYSIIFLLLFDNNILRKDRFTDFSFHFPRQHPRYRSHRLSNRYPLARHSSEYLAFESSTLFD